MYSDFEYKPYSKTDLFLREKKKFTSSITENYDKYNNKKKVTTDNYKSYLYICELYDDHIKFINTTEQDIKHYDYLYEIKNNIVLYDKYTYLEDFIKNETIEKLNLIKNILKEKLNNEPDKIIFKELLDIVDDDDDAANDIHKRLNDRIIEY